MSPRPPQSMPPPQEKRADIGSGLDQRDQQSMASTFPPRMSQSRDMADDTLSATKKDAARTTQSPSLTQQSPARDTPNHLSSAKYDAKQEKRLPTTTPISPAQQSRTIDKATDVASSNEERSRTETLTSSVRALDAVDSSADAAASLGGGHYGGLPSSSVRGLDPVDNFAGTASSFRGHYHVGPPFPTAQYLHSHNYSAGTAPSPWDGLYGGMSSSAAYGHYFIHNTAGTAPSPWGASYGSMYHPPAHGPIPYDNSAGTPSPLGGGLHGGMSLSPAQGSFSLGNVGGTPSSLGGGPYGWPSLSPTQGPDPLSNLARSTTSFNGNSHGGPFISPGNTTHVLRTTKDTTSLHGGYLRGSAKISSPRTSQNYGKLEYTSTSKLRQGKRARTLTGEQVERTEDEQHKHKRMKPSQNASTPAVAESALDVAGPRTSEGQGLSKPAQHRKSTTTAVEGHIPAATKILNDLQTPMTAQNATSLPAPAAQVSPIDRRISQLRQICGPQPALWLESAPPADEPILKMEYRMKKLSFEILDHSVKKVEKLNRNKVCMWLASNDVLPTLHQFKVDCMDDSQVSVLLSNALASSDSSWKQETELLASCAKDYDDIRSGLIPFNHPHSVAMLRCARFVRRLVRGSRANVMYYMDECAFPDMDRFLHELCARALLTAYFDYLRNSKGFFRILFDSNFVKPMTWQARKSRRLNLGFNRAVADAEYRTPSLAMQRAAVAFGRAM